jgi:hypothetical protein
MVLKEATSLPLNDPVAWRERSKKSLGKPHYLIRLLVLIQFPVLFVCVLTAGSGISRRSKRPSVRFCVCFGYSLR